jgi:secreted PhoX family phosphatase
VNEPVDLPPAPAPAGLPEEFQGKLTGSTRRAFIRDVAVTGTSTAAALYGLDAAGVADLVGEANAATADAPISEFSAIAPSSADALQVPEGFVSQVVIGWRDEFANTDGTTYTYGFNCDYLAFFPLKGSDEGLLFVNHEYPDPFFQHGFKPFAGSPPAPRPGGKVTKSIADVEAEKESTGNSIVHVRRATDGRWQVVTPSPYNRRIFGGAVTGMPATPLTFTGPLAQAGAPGSSAPDPKVHGTDNRADGSTANCSGGITPWGTALSCEENYDGYGLTFRNSTADFTYGWDNVDPSRPRTEQQDGSYVPPTADAEYFAQTLAAAETRKYGWVCEHDPYDPKFVGRKHTALGRFRHENTAFRVARGKKFVLYMGDDQANQGIYKFVSKYQFDPNSSREEHLKILTEGDLYIAKFYDEGRRRFSGGVLQSAESGTGEWVKVEVSELYDTRLTLAGFNTGISPSRRPKQGTAAGDTNPASANYAGRFNRDVTYKGATVNEWDQHFATNRPEDIEVAPDGSVFVALTNNSSVGDTFGSIRRMVEQANDPEALRFTWDDYGAGGPRAGARPGEEGYASPDNLVFDSDGGTWVVTDISSSALNAPGNPNEFHKNNALFYLPPGESRVAYRFANMPVQSEGTGPYFTPDESTLFVNVQHPGEEAKNSSTSRLDDPKTFASWWPEGNRTTEAGTPGIPRPSTVAIFRPRAATPVGTGGVTPSPAPVPPGQVPPAPQPGDDTRPPAVKVAAAPRRLTTAQLLRRGLEVELEVDEAATLVVELVGRVGYRDGRRRRTTRATTIARTRRRTARAGTVKLRLRPSVLARLLLRRGGTVVGERLRIEATDRSGNVRTTSRGLNVR